jgi:Fe-S cluster biogenesis protein NfuA
MIDSASVTAGLAPVREVLQSDGGDIELVGVEGGTARLRLVLESAGCAECVLPRPLLETIALQMMQPLVPGLSAVAIDDPREA